MGDLLYYTHHAGCYFSIPVSVAGSNIGVLRLPPGWDATNCM